MRFCINFISSNYLVTTNIISFLQSITLFLWTVILFPWHTSLRSKRIRHFVPSKYYYVPSKIATWFPHYDCFVRLIMLLSVFRNNLYYKGTKSKITRQRNDILKGRKISFQAWHKSYILQPRTVCDASPHRWEENPWGRCLLQGWEADGRTRSSRSGYRRVRWDGSTPSRSGFSYVLLSGYSISCLG